MIKKLTMKEVCNEQLEIAEKAAVKAGALGFACDEYVCDHYCYVPSRLYADQYIRIGPI